MTIDLLGGLVLLAIVDSLNPFSIAGLLYLLLTPRPLPRAAAYLAGTLLTYFLGGVAIFVGLDALPLDDILPAGRTGYLALGAAGAVLLGAGAGLDRRRPPTSTPPRSLHPAVVGLFGALSTLSDLPTAVPYLVAIGRLTAAPIGQGSALLALAGYVLVYVAPLLALLGAFLRRRGDGPDLLQRLGDHLQRWSRPVTVGACYAVGALLLANSAGYFLAGQPLF